MNIIYSLIRLNAALRNHHIKFASVGVANLLRARHLSIRIDPIMACNIACQMCGSSNPAIRKTFKGSFSLEELERLANMFFPLALQVVVGNATEPTLNKEYPAIVKMAKQMGVPSVGLATNGQLLNEARLRELMHYGLDELILSLHGTSKETYERLMKGASYDKFIEILDTVERLRAATPKSKLTLRFNYTACPDNFQELAALFEVFGKYRLNTIQIRPYSPSGGLYGGAGIEAHMDAYLGIVRAVAAECKQRGVTCLANTKDPTYQGDGYSGVILDAIRRDIRPGLVWRSDFDWRTQTYQEFCRHIGWSRHVFHWALQSRAELAKHTQFAQSLGYDVA